MSQDMTYLELRLTKDNINRCIEKLGEIASSQGKVLNQEEREFYVFLCKHIIFFKYLYNGMGKQYFFKVLISDLYYYIFSMIKNETRYVYVNQRSIIENCTRAVVRKTVEEDHVTEKIFTMMKGMNFKFDFTDRDYALIKSEYVTACGYIHGGDVLDDELAFVLEHCVDNSRLPKQINKYHERIKKIIKIYDKMLISEYGDSISGCFHRQKTIFEYLMGKECLDLLFKVTK